MAESKILTDITARVEKLNIFELRQVARAVGVHRPADGKKSRVIEAILQIAQGISAPEPQSLRGAPPKSQMYDEQLVADIKTCREYYLALIGGQQVEEPRLSTVSDSVYEHIEGNTHSCSGILDASGKYAFLRVNGVAVTQDSDIFVHESFINRYSLRQGDLICGKCMRKSENEAAGFVELISVNGVSPEEAADRRHFSRLTHIYPATTVKTSIESGDTACRMIDVFSPVALGQRAFISAPFRSGKTTLIKQIAAGISRNYPKIKVILLLLNARPEEVTDFKRLLPDCVLLYTTFDMPAESHALATELAFEYAKRQTELGNDTMVFFDGITRLSRSFASQGKAAEEINKLLYCACNAEEGGSLTVISTLATDDALYNEFIGLANMVIALSPELSARRIFPAIDARHSFADGDERLLSSEELTAAAHLRELPAEEIIKIFRQTKSNEEIILNYKR